MNNMDRWKTLCEYVQKLNDTFSNGVLSKQEKYIQLISSNILYFMFYDK